MDRSFRFHHRTSLLPTDCCDAPNRHHPDGNAHHRCLRVQNTFFFWFIKNGLKQKQTKHQEKPTQSTHVWGREKFNYVGGAFSKSHELN
jgi:hypothetical protein